MRRASLLLLLLLLLGCPARAPAPAGALEVDFAGCSVFRAGSICELLPDDKLHLWIAGQAGQPDVRTSAGPLPTPRGVRVAGGTRYRDLALPAGATTLDWRERRGDGVFAFRLELRPAAPIPLLERARELRRRGQQQEAERLLAEQGPKLAPELASRVEAQRGRIEVGHNDLARGLPRLRRSLRAAAAGGRLSDAVGDVYVLVYALLFGPAPDFAEARALLAEARVWAEGYAERRADVAYLEGLLFGRSGDRRGALRRLREAAVIQHRLGLPDERYTNQEIAGLLASFGRIEEALALQQRTINESADDTPCNRAAAATNLAWIAVLGQSSGPPNRAVPDPGPLLAAAREAHAGCAEAPPRRNAILNQAIYAAQVGAEAELGVTLAELAATPEGRTPEQSVWEADASARLLELRGRPAEALAGHLRHEALARALGARDAVLRSLVAQGRLHARLGRPARAVEVLTRGDRLLDELGREIALGEGRGRFLAFREETVRHLVDTLVGLGRAAQAAEVVRRARARLVRGAMLRARLEALDPDQRGRWDRLLAQYHRHRTALEAEAEGDRELSTEELAAAREGRADRERQARAALDEATELLDRQGGDGPAALLQPGRGELFLIYYPAETSWLGLATTTTGTRAVKLTPPTAAASAAELGARLIEPFAAELDRADRVRLFLGGAAERVGFASLPIRGRALGLVRPLEHGLDIGAARGRPRAAGRSVLVVGNPTRDLPGAAAEATMVAGAMRGAEVTALLEHEATRANLLTGLGRARWFHYAGHSSLRGPDGIDSALRLAHDARLTMADLLALPATPELVVLSGCEAGAPAARSGADDDAGAVLGLAQAFLAAGAAAVLAPAGALPDRAAFELMREIYREEFTTAAFDPAVALLRARARMAARGSSPPDFRVYVP